MDFKKPIQDLLQADIPTCFRRFGKEIDSQWVDKALEQTGTASIRRRRLPASLVVWLVIAMALFRDRSVQEVVRHLRLVLPGGNTGERCRGELATSAVPQARYRVGAAPMEVLFTRTAEAWAVAAAEQHRWRGLALFGVDGTVLRLQDTDENVAAFGLPASGRNRSGYPQARLVVLMALRSHLAAGAVFGPCKGKKTGEQTLACQLWPLLPESSLVIVDRGFLDYGLFFRLSHDADGENASQKHWLVRAKKNLRWKTREILGKGDALVELTISPQARKKDPSLPKRMQARAIEYRVGLHPPQTLLTSLTDAEAFPAKEIAALYHQRWEIELGYDEIKTHMLERQEALRSKKPEGVRQEIWGILLAYNLVRRKMLEIAQTAGVEPIRVSFRHSLQLIRVFCLVEAWTMTPGNLPKRLEDFHEMMVLLLLPERRPKRRYVRHVKIKMSNYKRNPGRSEDKESNS
jgi:hypothetical protein